MYEEIARFITMDDNGNEYEIIVSQNFIESRNRGGTTRIPGFVRFQTSCGLNVNCLDDEETFFEIAQTGQKLHRVPD